MDQQQHLHPEDLTSFAIQTFGHDYRPAGLTRLYGGAQKVIYDVAFTNGFHCLLYIWDISQNFFKEEIEEADRAWHSYGADLFALNHDFLTRHGIPTPALYALNRERERYSFDYAFVEYVTGPKLETYLTEPGTGSASGPSASAKPDELMEQFADIVKRMHGIKGFAYGQAVADNVNAADQSIPCHRHQLMNAEQQLAYAARHLEEAAANRDRLLKKLYELESRIAPRRAYGFIHGELGPDHVIVKNDAELYLIDIEGASFYDVEHEHGFLHLRFGEHYEWLRDESIDPARLAFYQLHHYLSLTAGGLKLQQRGFHDQALARGIMESNLRRALQFVG
ncbi:phosphotransferase [Paenibacillus lycopersici]|uniref:Phosphotransferase n=1 Tax=Paenibacillus lycopersici TaxID=2704462 RepID=A0A6C0G2M7_9BACL|nr:phosphotransferase [Paenibacillus lycopersici]QHT61489.1 phosphotransferase [Paenibacillus lycopersici]